MITINFKKATPQGAIDGIFRFLGKYIFVQRKNKSQIEPILGRFIQAGAEVLDRGAWIRINLFKIGDTIKLGDEIIDIEEPDEEKEKKLSNFYIKKLKEMNCVVNII